MSRSGITIVTDNDANPIFSWSVGSNDPFANTGSYRYMATVRSHPNSSRIPTPDIVYRESGITATSWQYTLAKNIASSGGPYRDYQVVVESYNSAGVTSAGNQIGYAESNQWNVFPDGYDIIEISNLRQTGIEMSLNIETQAFLSTGFYKHTGQYRTVQYMTSNGDVSIEFLSGAFDSDLVGGYLYVSSGRFPKKETALRSGEWGTAVTRTRFDFTSTNPKIFAQNAAYNIRNLPYGFMSISFYDEVDLAMITTGINVGSGLFLSDNAVVERDIVENGDASVVVGKITGIASSVTDPIILSQLSPGTHVLGYTTGEYYTNVVYVNGGFTNNVVSGRFLTSPYLPQVTGATVYLSNTIDDTLFVAVNNYPIRNISNPGFDTPGFVQYNIYTGATGVGIFLKRGDTIQFKARGNFDGSSWVSASWTGEVGYNDGSVDKYYGGATNTDTINGQPVFIDMGYFTIGSLNYPTN